MQRWLGPFPDPNLAGLELALLATAAIAGAARAWPGGGRSAIALRIACGLAGLAAVAGLAATGSRAGGLALGAGIVVLTALRVVPWRWALAGLAVAGLAFLVSGTGPRYIPDVRERSIHDRLVLWRATLALIADHPWSGVGAGLPDILGAWYLPTGMRLRFATALNDGLTCAARWGLPVLGAMAAAGTVLLLRAGRRAMSGDALAATAIALLAVHLVAGMFQAHLFAPWAVARVSAGGVLLLLVVVAMRPGPAWRPVLASAAAMAVALPLLVVLAAQAAAEAPWRTRGHGELLVAEPRQSPARGLVVILHHPEERARLVQDLAPRLHDAGLALALTTTPLQAEEWSGLQPRRLLLAAGDQGLLTWQQWRDGALPPDLALGVLDPDAAPGPARGRAVAARGPLLVLYPAANPSPSPASLAAAIAADQRLGPAAIASGSPGMRWPDAWPRVLAWWSSHGGP